MRIGIIYETTFPEFKGGVERWFSQLASGLAENSFDVVYLNGNERNSISKNLEYRSFEKIEDTFHKTGARSVANTFSYALATFKSLRKLDVEIVYLSSFPFLHIWVVRIFQKIKKRNYKIFVEWFEIPTFNYWKSEYGTLFGALGFIIQQLTLRMSDFNVSYLDSTRELLLEKKRKKQTVIKLPGICNFENIKIPTIKNVGKQDISQIGRLIQDKQPLLSLKAIKRLRESGWRGHFHLLGCGPLESDVHSFIHHNGMSEYVITYGDGSDEIKREILQKSAVLLHPSKREGFGLAIVEAASSGVPSILVRGEDNRSTELEINPKLISEQSDPLEIVELLEKVLANQEEYSKECGQWIRDRGSNMLATDSIAQLTSLLKSL